MHNITTSEVETLRLKALIARLEAIRADKGGDIPVLMCDAEPIVRVEVKENLTDSARRELEAAGIEAQDETGWHVVISDR